ncbi:MAG TPA: hypothetical protein VI942_10075 [Thermoanaerobaculia bacterium]|nr:hypothetical protein [Thermoanaerobaculia bacterium]
MSTTHPLVEEILGGESYELRVLAAQGILPLPPAELIPLQVHLADADDAFLADAARSSLASLDPRIVSVYLAADAPVEVLRYFATRQHDSTLLEPILSRRDVPRELLVELAPKLPADLQELLLLRQDAILERPEILDSLADNPRLSPYSRRRIAEYREHLLPRASRAAAVAVSSEQFFPQDEELSEEEQVELERIRRAAAGGDVDRTTGLSEHQIRALTVPLRLRLAQGASRTLRAILIKDSNTSVALAVLQRSAFTDDEIEQLAASRAVVDDVLLAIAKRREWTARYGVCLNLARNPRIPIGIAIKCLPRLSVRDLRLLGRDRNISDAVRSTAQRLYRIKVD